MMLAPVVEWSKTMDLRSMLLGVRRFESYQVHFMLTESGLSDRPGPLGISRVQSSVSGGTVPNSQPILSHRYYDEEMIL